MATHADDARRKRAQNTHKRKSLDTDRGLRVRDPSPARYDIDIPDDPGTSGLLADDFDFIKGLRAVAHTTAVTSDVLKEAASAVRRAGRNDGALMLPALLQRPPRYDVDLVTSGDELSRALGYAFNAIRAPAQYRLAHTHGWSIRKQITALGDSDGVAYQPASRPRNENSTHHVDVGLVRRAFQDPGSLQPSERSSNFLDMASVAPFTFRPAEISEVDLVYQIRTRTSDGSWTRGGDPPVTRPEWTILTKAPSCSPFHTDAAGYCTAVIVVEGSKVWHLVNGPWEVNRHRLASHGARYERYPNGVSAVDLRPGDCLIQAPGTIHAVITPEDCMMFGYFFYTAAHFARTVKCVRLEKTIYTNDDIHDSDFEDLALIVSHLYDDRFFDGEQREAIWAEVGDLLRDAGILAGDSEGFPVPGEKARRGGKGGRRARPAAPSTARPRKRRRRDTVVTDDTTSDNNTTDTGEDAVSPARPTPRERFLDACAGFWRRHLGDTDV